MSNISLLLSIIFTAMSFAQDSPILGCTDPLACNFDPDAIECPAEILIYENDFESGINPIQGWTLSNILSFSDPFFYEPGVSFYNDNNTYIYGPFGNSGGNNLDNIVSLDLNNLANHTQIMVQFDFYTFCTWDGSGNTNGPDNFTFQIDNQDVINANFANNPNAIQSYPVPNSVSQTGAVQIDLTPPFNFAFGCNSNNSTMYSFEETVVHTASSISLDFISSGLQAINDESWAIDNIKVFLIGSEDEDCCVFSEECVDCDDNSIDLDNDGVADCDEVEGCTDEIACNYNPSATEDDGSCIDLTLEIDNIQNISCFGSSCNDGAVYFSVNGGSGIYQFTIQNTSDGNTFINSGFPQSFDCLWAGEWELIVDEYNFFGQINNSCSSFITITEPSPMEFDFDQDFDGFINSTYSYTQYVCSDNPCQGQINVLMGGGTAPYLFELVDENNNIIQTSNSGIFNGICSGNYNVNVYDDNYSISQSEDCCEDACFGNFNLEILELDPVIDVELIDAGCGNIESLIFDISGGLSPYNIDFYIDNVLVVQEVDYDLNQWVFSDEILNNASEIEFVLVDEWGCGETFYTEITTLTNDIQIIDIETENPSCWDGFGTVEIEFSSSIINENIFGSLLIGQDLNGDCILNVDEGFEEIIIEGSLDNFINITLNNLEGGEFVFVIQDNLTGCTAESCFSIVPPPGFNPDVYLSCSGPNTCFEESGSANVSSDPLDIGGTPPYVIEWFNASTGIEVSTISEDALVATALSAGEYYVVVTDFNGCSSTASCTITDPPAELITGASSPLPSTTCCDSNDGEILIQPYGGVGDFYIIDINYSNSFGVSVPIEFINSLNDPELIEPGVDDAFILTNAYPGEYEIIVHDSDFETLDICHPDTANIIITAPECIEWTIITDPLPCFGDVIVWSNDDVLDGNFYNYIGGSGPADINWFPQGSSMDNMNNAIDINNIGPGTYNILSIDAAGCETVHGPIIIPYTPELQSDFNIYDSETSIYCYGDSTGIIAINTYYSGPNGEFIEANDPITYLWTYNGQYIPEYDNMNIVDSLPAGIYDISVNNNNDCGPILIPPIEIIEPDNPLSISEFHFDNECYGEANGSISLIPSGGSLNLSDYGYLYQWTGTSVDGDIIDLSNQENNQNLNNLPAGNYICYISIDNPDEESFISSCEEYIEVLITEPLLLELSTVESPISCDDYEDGAINLSVVGGTPPYTYQWSSGQLTQDINNIGAGFYTVSVNDSNDCGPVFISVELFDPNQLTYIAGDETVVTSANCFYGNTNSGQIAIHTEDLWSQLQGGTSPYSEPELAASFGDCSITIEGDSNINSDSIIFNGLSGGLYTICVDDANGCLQSYDVSVLIDNDSSIDIGYEINDATCGSNGSIYISSISNNGIPPYDITIINLNDPSIFYDFTNDGVNQWFESDNFDVNSNYILSNNSYGFDYNSNDWNGNNIDDIASLDIDGDGIINNEDWDIDGDSLYNNDDITPYGDNGLDSEFNDSEFGWNQVPPGEYEILIIDSQGCTGSQSVFVVVNDDTPIFSASIQPGNCYWNIANTCDSLSNNGAIVLNSTQLPVNTLYPYEIYVDGELHDVVFSDPGWQDENYVISSLEAGTSYTIEIFDANGCGYSNNGSYFEIPFLSNLNVEIIGFCPECQESNNGGFAYSFLQIEDDIITGLNPDIQIQTVGPATNDDIDILYTNTNSYTILECLNDLDIDNDGVINSDDDDIDGDGVVNSDDDDIDGDGVINSEDYDMSYDYDELNILQLDNLIDNFYFINNMWWDDIPDPNVLVDYHQDYLRLIDDTTDFMIAGLSYGTYDVTIIDEYGCQFTQEIDLSDEQCNTQFGSQQWENCLFIPSVFTPNGDGINDLWDIYNIELYEESGVKVTVYNRWGQIMYQNIENNVSNGTYSDKLWTGNNRDGGEVEIATYYYVIELDNYDKNYTGYVVVKR